ncbi:MAG TPA: hypothetical protein VGJ18_05760 [Gemmatimonadaceae bacterium]|jgi:hypothetical protein
MSNLHRYLAVATFVAPLGAISADGHTARAQVRLTTDTMLHVRADSATLAAQWRRAMSADRARQYQLDSIADATSRPVGSFIVRKRFYYGLAGGYSQPVSASHAVYATGWNVTVPAGWDFVGAPIGLRVDGSWDKLIGQKSSTNYISDVAIWSLDGGAVLRRSVERLGPSGIVYLLAGGGVHRFVASAINGGAGANANGFATSFSHAQTRWGFDGGVGASLTVWQLAMFVETRYVDVRSGNDAVGDVRFFPMILGVTFF